MRRHRGEEADARGAPGPPRRLEQQPHAGDGGEQFRAAMETVILPRLEAFGPEFVIVSSGFDAHMRDPLASLNFTEEDFAWATKKLMELADRRAGGRLISVLEGGYDLQGRAGSVAAHVTALMRG